MEELEKEEEEGEEGGEYASRSWAHGEQVVWFAGASLLEVGSFSGVSFIGNASRWCVTSASRDSWSDCKRSNMLWTLSALYMAATSVLVSMFGGCFDERRSVCFRNLICDDLSDNILWTGGLELSIWG